MRSVLQTHKLRSLLWGIALLSLGVISSCGDDDGPDVAPVDFSALNAKITEAEGWISSTEEGTADGQYLRGSQAILQDAIDLAKTVADDENSTQTAVDNTVIGLQSAIDTYEGSVVEPIDPDNLVGHWQFNEGSGTTVADFSGNSFDGEFKTGHANWGTGTPAWAEDRYGNAGGALYFEKGANVEVPYNVALNPPNISISLWLKADVVDPIWANNYMVAMNRWNGYKFQLQDSPKAFFTVNPAENPREYINKDNASPVLTLGEWWHVVVTFGNGHMIFYLDGEMVKDWDDTPGTVISLSGDPVNLVFGQDLPTDRYLDEEGDFFVDWGGYFIGALDEIRIYKSVLTAAQVQSIYELEKTD